ncbi:MAG: hypothetical protein AAF581_13145 [Planctomycetota bacterium]
MSVLLCKPQFELFPRPQAVRRFGFPDAQPQRFRNEQFRNELPEEQFPDSEDLRASWGCPMKS